MWLDSLFSIHSAVQAVAVLSAVCTLGLALGKLHYRGISLGIAFVFFIGIVAGHYGFTVDHDILLFAESFGLSMFVYALGLYVGPNFFGSLRHERSEEHTSELQSRQYLVCRLLLEKKNNSILQD